MSYLKRLIIEIHRRSIWQVLAVYVLGAAAGYQVIQSLTEGLGLPRWFPALAVVLFIVLLPVVLAAAVVREQAQPAKGRPKEEAPRRETERAVEWDRLEPTTQRHILTWRRALTGLIGVFALWGAFAAGWLVFGGRVVAPLGDTELATLRNKIVVLPFENLGSAEEEYFADGVTEEITSRLAEIPELGVISRTSALQYKDTEKTIADIGRELAVDYVLEGTVRWNRPEASPSRVRVTPQLIRVSDDTNIWTERYDEVLSDIFALQSNIAESVARALDIQLLEPQRRALAAKPTENLEAYDLYLRGNDSYNRRFVEEEARTAVRWYESAVELDPGFAQAWAALARARVWLHHQFGRTSELVKARAAVEEALRIAPDLADAHMAMGDYHYYGRRDYEEALEHYLTVQRRQPGNSGAIGLIAWIQRRQALWERSLANAERALELDPRNTVNLIGQAQNHFYLRRYPEAERYFLRAIALDPDVPYYYRWTIWYYLAWDGSTERAANLMQEAFRRFPAWNLFVGGEASWVILNVFGKDYASTLDEIGPDDPGVDSAYYYLAKAQIHARLAEPGLAREYYDSARAVLLGSVEKSPGQFAPHSTLAIAYAGLGRREEALREAERGVDLLPLSLDAMTGADRLRDRARARVMVGDYEAAIEDLHNLLAIPSPISANLLRVDPFWDPLRNNPRFQTLTEDRR